MAYIGRSTDKLSNIEKLDTITFDGSSSYTLQKNSVDFIPSSANNLQVSIDGVVQAGNFTVSGSTIDFGVAIPATSTNDFIFHYGTGLITTPADGTVTSAKISYPLTTFSSTGIDDNATSTAITIDSSENVGIGTSSPLEPLHVEELNADILLKSTSDIGNSRIYFGDPTSNVAGQIAYIHADNSLRTVVNGTEKMRIDSSGNVFIGKTTGSFSTAGTALFYTGSADFVNSDRLLVLNRLSTDGELMGFYQAGSQEGSISVSGATVSYNGFTGTHWSRFTDNSKPTILKGTVLESLDEMCDWYNLEFNDNDGNPQKIPHVLQDGQSVGDVITYDWNTEKKDENDNDIIEQVQATIVKEADIKHVKSKVSDTVDAKNVYGVFMAYDEDGEGYNDFYVASVGSFVVRIKANETIVKGDLLQSNGDGTAKVQTDDAVRSSSFAKVLSTTVIETYDDGSFIVPCSLMC